MREPPSNVVQLLKKELSKKDLQDLDSMLQSKDESKKDKKEDNPYFEGKVFIPKFLADELMSKYQFKYAVDILWVYQNGVYKPVGETFARIEAQKLLGKHTRSNRVQETIDYIKRATVDDIPKPNARYINVLNGRLNIEKIELQPHDPSIFDIIQIPVTYDAEATCPNFNTYLKTTLGDEMIALAEEVFGYVLLQSQRFEKAIMLTGTGKNGKSVFLDVIQYMLGEDNVSNVPLQELEEDKFSKAELLGKLANIFSDIPKMAMRESSNFKSIVSGDVITAQRKFGQPFKFRPTAKLLFSANELPRTYDNSYAFFRRWIIIPFNKTFDGQQADKSLRSKLKKELSGILNRSLLGLMRLLVNGEFTTPVAVQEALEKYKSYNDTVAAFCDECVEAEYSGKVTKQDFYNAYKAWCQEQGLHPVSQRKVKESLIQKYPNLDEYRPGQNGSWHWIGIQLIG
ncbi:DNA primase family protein [Petroclostridium sp. X23]|uniref:DNA primase family protein n=1 Tax=Petroclostridium sp. X23 TaxID=3045146 RepID=UPI0024ACC4A7|nr:DNA primase family protein [Petroclostridium sp. X23]WHH60416.1 phage/plasmid primase, P4 family [Petroclostridium sp. X23]